MRIIVSLLLLLAALTTAGRSPWASAQRHGFSIQSDALHRAHRLLGLRRMAAQHDGVTELDGCLAPSEIAHGRRGRKKLGAPFDDLSLFILHVEEKRRMGKAEIELRDGSRHGYRLIHLV